MRKVFESIRRILFWLVLIVSLGLIVLTFLPRCLGFSVCSIEDDSMVPSLYRGDWVLAKPVAFADIQAGDLLVFEDPKTGERFARTVAEIWTDKEELATVAPQFDAWDPYTTAYRCVVGRVVRTVRMIGYPSVWLHTTIGKVVLASLYIIWIAVEMEVFAANKRRVKSDA